VVCASRGRGDPNGRENLSLDAFPSPADLWARYRAWKGLTPEAEEIVLQDYHDDGSDKAPRYYQVNAVNAAIEAIAKGRNRVLLVMATGTGKTFTGCEIAWMERGGPTVNEPQNDGFGQMIITKIVPVSLQGTASLQFLSEGVRWTMVVPASSVLAKN